MLLTEFDEEKYAKAIKREGYEAGFSEGHETGFSEGRETGFSEGREAGFNEGICKGQSEERRKNIKSMIEMYTEEGIDLESAIAKISKKFGFTIDEIKKIL